MTQAVLLGGLFIGVLSALPVINIANCCCLWIVGGGALAAYFSQHDDAAPLRLIDGARIGFRAGVVGAVIWLISSVLIDAVMAPLEQRAAELMLRNAVDMPPEARAWLEGMTDRTSMPLRIAFGFVFQLCLSVPFAALGGLLGVALFGKQAEPHQEF